MIDDGTPRPAGPRSDALPCPNDLARPPRHALDNLLIQAQSTRQHSQSTRQHSLRPDHDSLMHLDHMQPVS